MSTRPTSTNAKIILEEKMKVSHHQAIDELLFSAITCLPNKLYSIIKLFQYNNKTTQTHYLAVTRVSKYLQNTVDDGLHYWRPNLQPDLPDLPAPHIPHDDHEVIIHPSNNQHPIGYIDYNCAGDTSQRCSISDICPFFSRASVLSCSRFQPTISLSSTRKCRKLDIFPNFSPETGMKTGMCFIYFSFIMQYF